MTRTLSAEAFRALAFGLTFLVVLNAAKYRLTAQDWPMWRYDAQRTAAASNSRLPQTLQPSWNLDLGSREQAWDDPLNHDLMTYDRILEPIVIGGRMFVGFNDKCKVAAFDAATGDLLWTCYTEAPVRLPPVGWNDRVYFTSDDGFLYCVEAESGTVAWKFSGAPSNQKVIGNRRLPRPGQPAGVRSYEMTPSTSLPAFGRSWERSSTHWMPKRAKCVG